MSRPAASSRFARVASSLVLAFGIGGAMAAPPSGNLPGVFVEPGASRSGASMPPVASMQRVEIVDATGFGRPMTAQTIEVPAGWTTSGGVNWDRSVECVANNLGMAWSATSPDGRFAVSLLPRLTWQVASATVVPMYPCPAAPMDSARSYLEAVVRNARPGARVLSYRDRPDLVAERRQAVANAVQGSRLWVESGEILIGYPLQGIEMRESIVAAVTFSEVSNPMVGRSLSASAEDAMALRAPDGQLDFALLERIRTSGRIERAWGEQMLAFSKAKVEAISQRQAQDIQTWHTRRMNEITTAGILERGRIRMDTIREVGRINNQIVASRDATSTRIHEGNVRAIQEVQPWRDPSTGQQVDLSIHYRHAWQLDDGRQFLTNDADFDPQRTLGINGHRLEPVP
ncbi:MAG: hypothetical protein J0L88_09705 [Xanthomonadales bacterium]|nr:hypothetical protein [Xanthomonadales bacterium]